MPPRLARGAKRGGPLQWFEDSVAYCDECGEFEAVAHLYEVPTLGNAIGGTWVRAVKCRDHAAVVAGRPAWVGEHGVDFQ